MEPARGDIDTRIHLYLILYINIYILKKSPDATETLKTKLESSAAVCVIKHVFLLHGYVEYPRKIVCQACRHYLKVNWCTRVGVPEFFQARRKYRHAIIVVKQRRDRILSTLTTRSLSLAVQFQIWILEELSRLSVASLKKNELQNTKR